MKSSYLKSELEQKRIENLINVKGMYLDKKGFVKNNRIDVISVHFLSNDPIITKIKSESL